jgi:hypothetical protein
VKDHQHPHNNGIKTASERLAKRRKICLQYLGRKTLILLLGNFEAICLDLYSIFFIGANTWNMLGPKRYEFYLRT